MADPNALQQDGINFAHLAVKQDSEGHYQNAIFYYTEAAQALLSAALAGNGTNMSPVVDKANEYILRAEALKVVLIKQQFNQNQSTQLKTHQQCDLERAEFLLRQAFDEDEEDNIEEAVDLYTHAVEMFLKIRNDTTDKQLQEKVSKLAGKALDRAEALKTPKSSTLAPSPRPARANMTDATSRSLPPLGFGAFSDTNDPRHRSGTGGLPTLGSISGSTSPTPSRRVTGTSNYTKDEIQVLRTTSFINNIEYVPFMTVDMRERFAYPVPFCDKSGTLELSPKQKRDFQKWARPDELHDNPQMIMAVSSFSVKQTIVSDCSFVASLAISAQYERRFKKKLITSIIYPKNRNGDPVYNPCGKYMVKLHLNGVVRKVIIDDRLPVDRHGDLLCSFSNNKGELWVSMLEKAYLKVMGGYHFHGSNSTIDLHTLTGWIPERVAVRVGSKDFDADKEFRKVLDRFHKGHCLVTIATGEMEQADADRAGLVPTHAYAMLDIREVKGKKLIMLKNPWSHLRWRGNFSETDSLNWTPEMQKLLNYDPKSAQLVDNGVFWIDYTSLLKFFDVICINWDPELFTHTTCLHHTWAAKSGPKKDMYNISDNPQYKLEIKSSQPCPVWVLLTRHITDKDDFAENKEFITLVVYKNGGRRVYYPYDPPPYKDGVRINSPHYLCKMVEDKGTKNYTLVVSQYEKNHTIHYTLRAFSTSEISLTRIIDPYIPKYEKQLTGHWKGKSAGGCGNNSETYRNNPIYQFKIDNNDTSNHILVELRGPKEYSVGFDVVTVSENVPNASGSFKRQSSGDFRRGFCVLELQSIAGGIYNVIPCTFNSGKQGPFFLNISSSSAISVSQLQ